jgi:hypothetical protein
MKSSVVPHTPHFKYDEVLKKSLRQSTGGIVEFGRESLLIEARKYTGTGHP